MGEFLLVAVLALWGAVSVQGGTSHLQLTLSPPHAHVRPQENLTVMCHASAPITHCQLSVGGETYDLSGGSASPPLHGVEYHGRGLGAGDCGFTINASLVLTRVGLGYPLTCRVRGRDSAWTYALMAVLASDNDAIPLSVDKHLLVAQPGSELNILYRLGAPVTKCSASFESWTSNRSIDLSSKGTCTDSSNVCSHGNGVEAMECGVTVKNVTEDFNGIVWFNFYGPTGEKDEKDFVLIIVAHPPSPPVLSSDVTVVDSAPATLRAECRVGGSRPAANITWYLDGKRVSQQTEGLQYVTDDAWTILSSTKTTTQTLTRQLSDADIGRELWCVAEHPSLGEGGRPSRRVTIQVPMCPPLTSKTLLISCFLGVEPTDCAKRQYVGTVAHLSCKPGLLLPHDVIFKTTTCGNTAKWDIEIFKCSPDCGRRKSNSGTPLISNGEDANVGEFPWHVGIYRQMTALSTPVQICGGSLITTRVVVSAAHCFYNNVLGRMHDSSEFRVVAGKHSREWTDQDAEEQQRNVTEIRHKLYGGRNRNFASDIALVRLSEEVEVNANVNLVCLDWENMFELWQLRAGSVGVVPGWGVTETGSQSSELKYIEQPYVPLVVCYESLMEEQKPILTNDKFCAGYNNRSQSVCRGDSGGGLVFREVRSDKYYLRGVVSVGFKPSYFEGVCYSDQYVSFTLVSQYVTWIKGNIRV